MKGRELGQVRYKVVIAWKMKGTTFCPVFICNILNVLYCCQDRLKTGLYWTKKYVTLDWAKKNPFNILDNTSLTTGLICFFFMSFMPSSEVGRLSWITEIISKINILFIPNNSYKFCRFIMKFAETNFLHDI